MAVLGKSDLIAKINTMLGENPSDEALSLLEDVSDTITDYEKRSEGKEDWETKYHELDKSWRTKYRDRFLSKPTEPEQEVEEDDEPDESTKKLDFKDLFKEE